MNPNRKFWNVPNVLTLLRLAMVPAVVYLLCAEHRIAALIVFAAASLTDALDGYIARHWNLITDFGKLADPFADKLMIVSTIFTMSLHGDAPLWLSWAMLGKELLMIVGGAVLYKQKDIIQPARLPGKLATVLFMLGMIMTFLNMYTAPYNVYILYLAAIVSFVAFGYYFRIALQQMKQATKREN